ncbi:phage tail tape measure protein [Corynebacterium aurimucosum]|uniref:phage tail tape measure protein n=1 Tax=Corynebacterium aurimucosum TaxID=169292 RepID=UPI0039909FBD
MAGAAGYAVLPTTISLSGISKELQDKLLAPASKAAKQAGDSIEKGITKGSDDAAKRVEKANYRVKKSSEELAAAESKRNSEVLKSQAAAKQLEAAESKLSEMKKSGKASSEQLARAEADVLNKRARVETAAQNVEKAERGVEKAMAESKRASDSLAAAQKELESATDEATGATKEFGDAAADADGKGQGFEVSLGKIAAAGAVVVGAVGAAGKAAYDIGSQFDDAYDTIRAGTGASGAAFEELQDSMRKVAGESIGVGSDMGAIGSTLADLNTRLGLTGEPLEEMTAQFMQLQNLGVDADINEVSKAMSGFGIEAKDMPGALDELFQVSQATGLTITELSQSAVKAGPVLRGFGFSMADSAALVGQMDKAGLDADKTLQSMQRALAEFASEGRDAPEALKETIGSIEELINAGDDAAAIDMASGIFGTRGAAQFVDAVKTGTLSVDDFMDATGATSDTIGGLAEETADFAEHWDQFKNQAMLALEPIAAAVFDSLVPALDRAQGAFEFTLDAVKGFAEWVQKSKDWLLPLGAGLTVVAGGLAAVAFQQKVIAAGGLIKWFKSLSSVTKLMTGVQAAFNMVMAANPIALITIAIAGLVAGLVVFFTKTETGRKMWESFTEALATGWDWVVEKFKAGLDWVRENFGPVFESLKERAVSAWDGLVQRFQSGWDNLKEIFDTARELVSGVADILFKGDFTGLPFGLEEDSRVVDILFRFRETVIAVKDFVVEAWGSMSEKWGEFTTGFGQFYETWISPVVSFMGTVFQTMGTIVVGALKGIWTAMQFVGTVISTVWSSVIQPTLSVFMSVVQAVASFVAPIFTAMIGGAFRTMGTLISDIWNGIIKPTWDFFRNAAGLLADVLTGNFSNIGNRFSSMGDAISNVVRGAINAAMNLFKSIFENAKGVVSAFADSVGNMVGAVRGKIGEMLSVVGEIPGKIKNVFANAGSWLVNAGKNIISGLINGIKSMFGQVGNAIGSIMPDKIRGMMGFASGGLVLVEGGITRAYVDGGIDKLERYANGGTREDHRAQIARGGEWRVWAEPETGGESYIPLAKSKRKRSTEILAKTADIFGLTVLDKDGERITPAPYSAVAPMRAHYFANGGVVSSKELLAFASGQNVKGKQAPGSLEGSPYVWGGGLLGNWGDCSGAMSGLAAFAIGMDLAGRKFATGNEGQVLSQMGFSSGMSPGKSAFEIGLFNGGPYGGHTSGTIYDANGHATNVEMGGGRGNGQIAGAAAGARHSQYTDRYWIGLKDKPPVPPKMNEILPMAETGEIDTSLVTGESTSSGSVSQTVKLSPEEAAIATAANELGDKSVVEHFTEGLLDMAGLGGGLLAKILLGKPGDWLPSGDSIVTEKQVQVPTSGKKEEPKVPVDKSVAPAVVTPDEARKAKTAEWGQPFFASEIAEAAKRLGVGAKGAKIGVATALVESGNPMKMWANRAVPESLKYRHDAVGSDYDSVGLFQQRDNGAWGEVWQRMDPYESAAMFFRQLHTFKWQDMEPGAAAQKVQVSAFPGRYAQQMGLAEKLVNETGVFGGGSTPAKPEVQLKGAFQEFSSAWDGADAGLVDTSLLLRSEDAAKSILNLVEERGKAKTGIAAKDASPVASYKHLMTTGDYDGRMAQIGIHEDDDLVGAVIDARRAGAVYDQGGWLKPGGIAVNLSNEPEPVFNGDQWRDIKRGGLKSDDGMTLVVNLEGQEVLRKRVDKVEGEVTINTEEIDKLRRRTSVAVAGTTRGGAM